MRKLGLVMALVLLVSAFLMLQAAPAGACLPSAATSVPGCQDATSTSISSSN